MKKATLLLVAITAGFVVNAQLRKLIGSWYLVSIESIGPDGTISYPYGPSPAGLLIFASNGEYSIQILKTGRVPVASGNKNTATPDENAMMVQGNNSHFGTYSFNSKDSILTYKVAHAFFPNWENTELKTKAVLEKELLKSYSSSTTFGSSKAIITWRKRNN